MTGALATPRTRLPLPVCSPAVPVLDTDTVRIYQRRLNDLRQFATIRELREFMRTFVADISLAPATDLPEKQSEPAAHEITINFKALPAQFVKGMGAGAAFVAVDELYGALAVMVAVLSRNGRGRRAAEVSQG